MRIAVLLYGRINTCAEHYKNILWTFGENQVDFFLSSDNASSKDLDVFIKLYKPILYSNDIIYNNYNLDIYDYLLEPYRNIIGKINNNNMICHFINKGRVFKLLEIFIDTEKIHYDYVVSLRIDLVFRTQFNFNIPAKLNTIYIPHGSDFVFGINDQIAYGDLEVMKKYMNIFANIFLFLDNKITIPHPENLTKTNILYNELTIERFNLDYFIEK
jgi:hypothetical protein